MNKEIYYIIYQYMVDEILGEGGHFAINLDKDTYVSIFRRADGDIDISLYADEYHEENIDGGGVINMEDEITIDDMNNILEKIDADSISKYIQDKAMFAYDLIFNG